MLVLDDGSGSQAFRSYSHFIRSVRIFRAMFFLQAFCRDTTVAFRPNSAKDFLAFADFINGFSSTSRSKPNFAFDAASNPYVNKSARLCCV